jgi:predicted helicase
VSGSTSISSLDINYVFPLYIYPDSNGHSANGKREPNLNLDIIEELSSCLGLPFVNEKENNKKTFSPMDVLDYIYAVLHTPSYRERYKEFLKVDFPRVPYPVSVDRFWELVGFGGVLRKLHLLEDVEVPFGFANYPAEGSNKIANVKYVGSKVYINDVQYFDGVSEEVFNFYIGGYQPCQKWLKDRKDSTLVYDDITHYQKIIYAISETLRIMSLLDDIVDF